MISDSAICHCCPQQGLVCNRQYPLTAQFFLGRSSSLFAAQSPSSARVTATAARYTSNCGLRSDDTDIFHRLLEGEVPLDIEARVSVQHGRDQENSKQVEAARAARSIEILHVRPRLEKTQFWISADEDRQIPLLGQGILGVDVGGR